MRLQASYTYTNARDRFSQFGDGTLQTPRIYPQVFNLVVLQQFGSRLDATLEFTASSNYLYPFGSLTFVFRGQRLKLRLYTRVANVTEQTFYEDGFRTPGRWAVAGTTLSF